MMKIIKVIIVVAASLLIAFVIAFSNPISALKIGALANDCEWKAVKNAEFKKAETIRENCDKYMCTNDELEDELTGACHSTWYVYKVLFLYIPKWSGNC